MQVGPRKVIVSVPTELSDDHAAVMQLAQATGRVTEETIRTRRRWQPERVGRALAMLVREGMVWIDEQASPEEYWFPRTATCHFDCFLPLNIILMRIMLLLYYLSFLRISLESLLRSKLRFAINVMWHARVTTRRFREPRLQTTSSRYHSLPASLEDAPFLVR